MRLRLRTIQVALRRVADHVRAWFDLERLADWVTDPLAQTLHFLPLPKVRVRVVHVAHIPRVVVLLLDQELFEFLLCLVHLLAHLFLLMDALVESAPIVFRGRQAVRAHVHLSAALPVPLLQLFLLLVVLLQLLEAHRLVNLLDLAKDSLATSLDLLFLFFELCLQLQIHWHVRRLYTSFEVFFSQDKFLAARVLLDSVLLHPLLYFLPAQRGLHLNARLLELRVNLLLVELLFICQLYLQLSLLVPNAAKFVLLAKLMQTMLFSLHRLRRY